MLQVPCAGCRLGSTNFLTLLVLLQFLAAIASAQSEVAQQNITIPNTSSQIVYTPSICNDTSTTITDPQSCNGAWEFLLLNDTTVVSTNGPDPEQGSIVIPQMFMRFRAYAMYIYPSQFSNATANITVSADQAIISANFNSSVGVISILGLLESFTTTVTLTFVPSSSPTRLDIESLTLTVPDNVTETSSILPTVTLPPAMTLSFSTFTSTSTSTSMPTPTDASSNRNTLVSEAVGIVIGLGFGLTAVAVVGYTCWRRRRLKKSDVSQERGVGHEKGDVRT